MNWVPPRPLAARGHQGTSCGVTVPLHPSRFGVMRVR